MSDYSVPTIWRCVICRKFTKKCHSGAKILKKLWNCNKMKKTSTWQNGPNAVKLTRSVQNYEICTSL